MRTQRIASYKQMETSSIIVKEPSQQSNEYKFTCNNCSTTFYTTDKDIAEQSFHLRSLYSSIEKGLWCMCPNCGLPIQTMDRIIITYK